MTDQTTDTAETVAVTLPDAPAIPGLRFRRLRDERDWAIQADLYRAASLADDTDYVPTAEGLRIETENQSGFQLDRDLLLAEVDGRVIASAEGVVAIRDGRPVHQLSGVVHPDWRRRGIGRAMLRWNERRAREVASDRPPATDGPEPELGSWVSESETGAIALLEGEGYAPRRYYFSMIRRGLDDVEPIPLPDGLELRPVEESQHRAIWLADDEAFRDHYEHRAQTEEDYVALFSQPELDTSLWQVAWDGDEIAGSVLPWVWPEENEAFGVDRGWLERISVRRPWRRRGLARALIAAGLIALRERGMTEAMLGVDAENLTGALRLYEAMGFEVKQRSTAYRKPLRG
jgi:mycothiol synthase